MSDFLDDMPDTPMNESRALKAGHFLLATCNQIGDARGEVTRTHSMLKSIEAIQKKKSDETALNAQEREARASPEYIEALNQEAEAVARFETLRAKRDAAIKMIDLYQTTSSNIRAGV